MKPISLESLLAGFIGGAIGVITLHQGLLLIFHSLGLVPFAPYSLRPTAPFGIPQVLSITFWGGIWGSAFALASQIRRTLDRPALWTIFGAILPSLVAALIVTPLKGGNTADWLDPRRIAIALILNGAWGLTAWFVYRLILRRRLHPA